jgi:hypothetical protein
MVNYIRAFQRPFDDLLKLTIGAVLYMLQIPIVYIIPLFLASGYSLVCAKNSIKGDNNLPLWSNFIDMFVKGMLAMVITIIFIIPSILVSVLWKGPDFLNKGLALFRTQLNLLDVFGMSLVVFIVLFLLALYVLPYALMKFVDKNRFTAAFDLIEIFERSFTPSYFFAWIVCAAYIGVVSLVMGLITMILMFIPSSLLVFALLIVISGYISIITSITVMTIFGEVYRQIR